MRLCGCALIPRRPVNSVNPDEDITLDGTTECTVSAHSPTLFSGLDTRQAFNSHTTSVYNSSIFQEKAKEASSFFSELSPYVGGRALQLSNMVRLLLQRHMQTY